MSSDRNLTNFIVKVIAIAKDNMRNDIVLIYEGNWHKNGIINCLL